jgi:hypothetical protein
MDYEKHRHDLSRYERPTQRFRCGRAATWNKPCEYGPDITGRCGGTKECVPARLGDRWECRRSAIAGGPCEEGPSSDGACSHTHPPCLPKRSLRSLRAILSASAFTLVVSIIAVFLILGGSGGGSSARDSIISAGGLTSQHASIATARGCESCHLVHDENAGDWFLAAFKKNDMTDQCLDCHTFGGDARSGHNAKFAADLPATECVMCHTEHKGENANITRMSDSQCNACHEVKIDAFDKNHPEFGPTYPHDRRTAIRFDHVSHMSKHFQIPRNVEKAPQACADCHSVESAVRAPIPASYGKMCADCHAGDITSGELVLLSLPEFEEDLIDHDMVGETCEPSLEQWETVQETLIEMTEAREAGDDEEYADDDEYEDEDEYLSISENELGVVNAYLLGVPYDDMDEYSEPMQEFVSRMVEEGPAPVAEIIDERAGAAQSGKLLAGLSPELVTRVACAWANNEEFVPRVEHELSGWYADGVELRYRPAGHGDAVVKSWIEFSLSSTAEEDADRAAYAEAMRDQLLFDSQPEDFRVGACTKCHAVSQDDGVLSVEWKYRPSDKRRYTAYSHGIHFTLFNPEGVSAEDPDRSCRNCHKINEAAAYGEAFAQRDPHNFDSNYFPVSQETCANCHSEKRVKQDCQLCHVYHYKPGLDLRVVRHDSDP